MAALASGAIGSWVWLNSGSDDKHGSSAAAQIAPKPVAPLAKALSFVPANAAVVGVADTDQGKQAVAGLLQIASQVPGSADALTQLQDLVKQKTGLDVQTALPQLAGNPLVVAVTRGQTITAAWVVKDATALSDAIGSAQDSGAITSAGTYKDAQLYTAAVGAAIAVDGDTLLAATGLQALRDALDRPGQAGVSLTPEQFAKRTEGVPPTALLRVAASGSQIRRLIESMHPSLGRVASVSALSSATLGVFTAGGRLRGRLVLRSAPGVLTESDIPLAPGATAPPAGGDAELSIGIHDLAHLANFVLDAGRATGTPLIAAYQQIDELLTKFARIDVEQQIIGTLTGDALITSDDLKTFNLRAETTDPSGVDDALSRIAGIGSVGGMLGVDLGGFGIQSADDGLVTITKDDQPVVTLGIRDGVFVASTDQNADFDAIAQGPQDTGDSTDSTGALRAELAPKDLMGLFSADSRVPQQLGDVLGAFDKATVTAKAAPDTLTVDFALSAG